MSDDPSVLITTRERNGAVVVGVEGEIDLTNADVLQRTVEELRSSVVILDLTSVRYLDSSGIRAIERGFHRLSSEGRTLLIVSPPDTPAGWTLRVAGFDRSLVVDSVDAALGRSS
jgi:anti-anti-sigma factor